MSAVLSGDRSAKPVDVLIRASAGTGKTFQLSNRFLERLFQGVAVDRILATTFTRKAAGEILERVLLRLAAAVLDEDARRELDGHVDVDLTPELCERTLRDLTASLHRVRVGTLDAFFSRIAKSHTLELGLPPGWDIVEEQQAKLLVGRAVEALLHGDAVEDVVRMMHLLSKGAATRAVAETVRRTATTFHDLYVEAGHDAWHGFEKPTFPTAEQFDDLLEELRTVALPDHKGWRTARDDEYRLAVEGEWEELIGKGISAKVLAGEDKYRSKEIEPAVRDVYERLLAVARAHIVEQMRVQTEATYDLLTRYDDVHGKLKRAERSLRFDDVTNALVGGLETLDSTRLAYRLDGRVDHLLLDEFQDTSIAQWRVVRTFAERVAGPNQDRSLFCVGDGKQAIYRWRGGVAEILDNLEDTFDVDRQLLRRSFRSAPVVIETVNTVFKKAPGTSGLDNLEEPVKAWCKAFPVHETARTDYDGFVQLHVAPDPDEDHTPDDRVIEKAVSVVADVVRRCPGASVGVLTRSNRIVGRMVHALRKADIPASEEGGTPLVDSAAVGLIVSLLKLADHPGSTAPRYHVARSPLGRFLGFTDHRDTLAAAALAERIRRDLVVRGYGEVVLEWARGLAPVCGDREATRLRQLVRLAHDFEPLAGLRTRDFVEFIRNEKVSAPSRHDVRVMTVHQSKGLQFDAVVLPELDVDLFKGGESHVVGRPSPTDPPERICLYRNAAIRRILPPEWQDVFAGNEAAKTGESLCLLYVALTRAVHELQMIVPPPPRRNSVKKTYARILRHALGKGKPGEVAFETGHVDWHARRGDTTEPPPPPAPAEPLSITLAPMPEGRRRGLERIAPSRRDESRTVELHEVLSKKAGPDGRDVGNLIHAWFEAIDWMEDGVPDDRVLRRIAVGLGSPTEIVESCQSRFRAMVREPEIAWALSRGSYRPPRDLGFDDVTRAALEAEEIRLEAHAERRFAVRSGSSIVNGTIDRLVLLYHGETPVAADILDFKTDHIPKDDPAAAAEVLAKKIAHYRTQLETYRPAVATMYHLDPARIAIRLLMLSNGTVERL